MKTFGVSIIYLNDKTCSFGERQFNRKYVLGSGKSSSYVESVLMRRVLFRRVKSTDNSTNSAGTFQNCPYEERVLMERVLMWRDDCKWLFEIS